MRLCRLIGVLFVLIILSAGIVQAKRIPIQRDRRILDQRVPTLHKVLVYTYALNTASISVDFQSGELECLHPGCDSAEYKPYRKSHPKGYPATRIRAALRRSELQTIRSIVTDSSLCRFEPSASDVKKRCPNFDECPPTIVLVWSDRNQVLEIPLDDTVKPTLQPWRKGCYEAMDRLYQRIDEMVRSYDRKPFTSILSSEGPEYTRMEKQRHEMLKK